MKNVTVHMDQMWAWWPVTESDITETVITLSDAFLAEFESVSARYQEMQQYLEHCYRHQQGFDPRQDSPFMK